jgi:hypothetical protein
MPCLSRAVTFYAHNGQLIEFLEVRFSVHMIFMSKLIIAKNPVFP